MSNLHDHVNEDGMLYSEIDEDLVNENFEEHVWDTLDEALHEKSFFQKFQEIIFKALIENHAESVYHNGVKNMLIRLAEDM